MKHLWFVNSRFWIWAPWMLDLTGAHASSLNLIWWVYGESMVTLKNSTAKLNASTKVPSICIWGCISLWRVHAWLWQYSHALGSEKYGVFSSSLSTANRRPNSMFDNWGLFCSHEMFMQSNNTIFYAYCIYFWRGEGKGECEGRKFNEVHVHVHVYCTLPLHVYVHARARIKQSTCS